MYKWINTGHIILKCTTYNTIEFFVNTIIITKGIIPGLRDRYLKKIQYQMFNMCKNLHLDDIVK